MLSLKNFYKFFWVLRAVFLKPIFGKIGNFSYIGKPIFLLGVNKAFLGNNVRLFPNARIEVHENGKLVIEDNVSIGQSLHIICSEKVNISSGCLLSANIFITDTDHTFSNLSQPVHVQKNVSNPTVIGKNCFIGYGAVIQAGTVLGDNCIVGANSTVKGHFVDGSVIVGSPGRVIKVRKKNG